MMSYPSDLTEVEWKKIKHPFEPCERRGSIAFQKINYMTPASMRSGHARLACVRNFFITRMTWVASSR